MSISCGHKFGASGTGPDKAQAKARAFDNARKYLDREAPDNCRFPLDIGPSQYHQDPKIGLTYETQYQASPSEITIADEEGEWTEVTIIWNDVDVIRLKQGSDRYTGKVVDRREEDGDYYVDLKKEGDSHIIELRLRGNYLKVRLKSLNHRLAKLRGIPADKLTILKRLLGID